MEKRELEVLSAVVLGIVVIGFFGDFTGYAVNEVAELSSEKSGFWQKIKDFFKR